MHATLDINLLSATALNPQWLKENLPRYLQSENGNHDKVDGVEILHVGDSKKRLTLLYGIDLEQPENGIRRQLYLGYVVPADHLADEHKSVLRKATIQPAWGLPVALVPEANLVLSAFPNDRKMPLLTEEELQSWLKEQLPEFVGGLFKSKKMRQRLQRWQVQETRMEVLRYVPGKRLTARCTVRMKRDDGDETNISFIAKQLNDGKKAEQSFHTLRALHKVWSSHGFYLAENAAALPAPAPFPRALALNKERAVIFIEELPGKNLAEALTEVDLAQVMPAAGALLAAFHRIPKQVKKRVSRKSELKEVRKALGTIGTAFPELEPRLQKLFGTLCALHWEDNTPMALLHGSLRLNHLVIHEGRLALLDLDSLRLGPPAYDLANLLSSLYYFEAQGRLSRSQRQQITRYFLEGYAAQAAWNLAPRVVLWFLISLLINKQALKYVTHFHPDRAEKVTRMLQQAENILEQGYRQANDSTLSALWQVLP